MRLPDPIEPPFVSPYSMLALQECWTLVRGSFSVGIYNKSLFVTLPCLFICESASYSLPHLCSFMSGQIIKWALHWLDKPEAPCSIVFVFFPPSFSKDALPYNHNYVCFYDHFTVTKIDFPNAAACSVELICKKKKMQNDGAKVAELWGKAI